MGGVIWRPERLSDHGNLGILVAEVWMTAMTTQNVLNTKRDHILQLAAQHGAHNVRVFGSVARGEAVSTSDIDLLVQMHPGRSLLDVIALSQELESVLHCHVDILTDEGLSPYLAQHIQAEAVPL